MRRIVEVLMLPLTEREKRALNHDVPASARAYEFYLRANHLQRERRVQNLVLARDLYRECVGEDPNYAAAWARLGRCYRFLQKFGEGGLESLELAQWAFKRAFALNPDLSIAHNLYTQIEADLGNAQAAMVRLLAHAETHPHDPELFAGLVQSCRFCGLLEESVMAHQRARRLDSRAVTSVAHTFFLMGDYAHALESYDATAGYYLDAAILALTGREAEAVKLLSGRNCSGVRAGWMRALIASLVASLNGDLRPAQIWSGRRWRNRQEIRKPSSTWRGIWRATQHPRRRCRSYSDSSRRVSSAPQVCSAIPGCSRFPKSRSSRM